MRLVKTMIALLVLLVATLLCAAGTRLLEQHAPWAFWMLSGIVVVALAWHLWSLFGAERDDHA